jgi:hypothetical protein
MNYQVNLLKRVMISILISHNSPQQADVAGNKIIIIFFFCKKIIKYYKSRQFVVELL